MPADNVPDRFWLGNPSAVTKLSELQVTMLQLQGSTEVPSQFSIILCGSFSPLLILIRATTSGFTPFGESAAKVVVIPITAIIQNTPNNLPFCIAELLHHNRHILIHSCGEGAMKETIVRKKKGKCFWLYVLRTREQQSS